MYANFEINKHNHVGYFDPKKCSVVKFKPWIQFSNEHSIFKYDIVTYVAFIIEPLKRLCHTTVVSRDNSSFTFSINDTPYMVNKNVLK